MRYTASLLILAAMAIAPASVTAGTITLVHNIANENDCAGFFNGDSTNGFAFCDIGKPFDVNISPVVAKFDWDEGGKWQLNSGVFPSVTGAEFAGSDFVSDSDGTGTWTYAPGAGDPVIKYWSVKGGNGFNLFWVVNQADTAAGQACEAGSVFTVACLQKALEVNGGSYATPINANNNKNFGLSHITFYDTKVSVPENGATVTFLGLGLLALVTIRTYLR